jgi:hypothetical protein
VATTPALQNIEFRDKQKALSVTPAEACLLEEILQNQRQTHLILIILHKKSDANQMKRVFSTDGKSRPQNSVHTESAFLAHTSWESVVNQ